MPTTVIGKPFEEDNAIGNCTQNLIKPILPLVVPVGHDPQCFAARATGPPLSPRLPLRLSPALANRRLLAGSAGLPSARGRSVPGYLFSCRLLYAVLVSLAVMMAVVATPALAATPRQEKPPSALLVTLDTTRADRLGCYGFPGMTTPWIDKVSRAALVAERAFSHVPLTLPSHACMLTGLLPPATGIHDNGVAALNKETATLAGVLSKLRTFNQSTQEGCGGARGLKGRSFRRPKAAGTKCRSLTRSYDTAAVIGSVVLDRIFGLDQGFDRYDDDVRSGPDAGGAERTSDEVVSRVQSVVSRLAEPFFLWVHFYDPHFPYEPEAPFDAFPMPYDGEIASVDHGVARMFALLRKAGKLKKTIVVLAGDHGESLGAHGESSHGLTIYDTAMHVPLIILGRGHGFIGSPVPLRDIAATILDALGQTAALPGESLLGAKRGTGEAIYQETEMPLDSFGWHVVHGVRQGRFHLVEASQVELYDTDSDPSEHRDLSAKATAIISEMHRELLEASSHRAAADAVVPPPNMRKALVDLGYLEGARRGAKADLASLAALAQAKGLHRQGRTDAAVALLRSLVEANGDNVPARTELALCYLEVGEAAAAERQVRAALQRRQADYLYINLGRSLDLQGKTDLARQAYRKALELNPRHVEGHLLLANLEIAAGRVEAARKLSREAAAHGLHAPELLLLAGRLAAASGDMELALRQFRRCIEENPNVVEGYTALARARLEQGDAGGAVALFQKALDRRPNDVALMEVLAVTLWQKLDRRIEARRYLERALDVEQDPTERRTIRRMIDALGSPQKSPPG